MTKNCDQSVKINHNPNWPYILDHPHRILIVDCSRSGKANVLLNLIKHQQPHIAYKSKIHTNQIINYLFMEGEKQELKIKKTQKHLLIIHKQLMIIHKQLFVNIWKMIIQQEKGSFNRVW